jgi:Holliday junction resolvase RusA-like endonuclease
MAMIESRLRVIPPPAESAVMFFTFGQAVPQPRPKITVRCGFGQAYVPREHPIHAWRAEVEDSCREAFQKLRRETLRGPVAICIEVMAERPKGHWLRSGAMSAAGKKAGPPRGDWDNFSKAIQDSVVDAGGIEDDRNATGPNAVLVRWAMLDEAPGALVWVAAAETVACVWGDARIVMETCA